MEALWHLLGAGRRGGEGLLGLGEGFVRPVIPSLHCPPPAASPAEWRWAARCLGQGVGVEMAEAGWMFSSAEHSSFGPGRVPRGKISSG